MFSSSGAHKNFLGGGDRGERQNTMVTVNTVFKGFNSTVHLVIVKFLDFTLHISRVFVWKSWLKAKIYIVETLDLHFLWGQVPPLAPSVWGSMFSITTDQNQKEVKQIWSAVAKFSVFLAAWSRCLSRSTPISNLLANWIVYFYHAVDCTTFCCRQRVPR